VVSKLLEKELCDMLGSECYRCGFCDYRALQISLKEGSIIDEYEQFGHPIGFWKYYLFHTNLAHEKLQMVCANCKLITRTHRPRNWSESAYMNTNSMLVM